MSIVALLVLLFLLFPSEAWLQTRKPASTADLVNYLGADREQVLYAGAKAEGKLFWYTSLREGLTRRSLEFSNPNIRASKSRLTGRRVASWWCEWRKSTKLVATLPTRWRQPKAISCS
jgi:hypothetical protein